MIGNVICSVSNEPSIAVVCIMGIATVFAGLVCLVLICTLMGAIVKLFKKSENEPTVAPATTSNNMAIPNRQEMVAAISAAIAEDLGKDVSAIKILSIKRK